MSADILTLPHARSLRPTCCAPDQRGLALWLARRRLRLMLIGTLNATLDWFPTAPCRTQAGPAPPFGKRSPNRCGGGKRRGFVPLCLLEKRAIL